MTLHALLLLSMGFALFSSLYLTTKQAWQPLLLLAANLCFYLTIASWAALLQLLIATGVTYALALRIETIPDPPQRRRLVLLGILLLAGNLAVCKYAALLNDQLRALFGAFGRPDAAPALDALLTVGISFYTFQLIAYVVDVHRGQPAERAPLTFFNSIALFTKIVAGPIERSNTLLPQLRERARFDAANALEGAQLIAMGAFKKLVVADQLAVFVAAVYDAPASHDGAAIALATLLYAFQIYFDFSGYVDIACGAARVLGYRLTPNFNRPYCATSIQDFWKRWHISLGAWLTDYIYAPLLRQRRLKIKLYYTMMLSILATFLVSGLWHGAHWNFLIWGALHGCYTVASVQLLKPWSNFASRSGLARHPSLHRALKIGTTFSLVCFAYLFFRGNSVSHSLTMIKRLATEWVHPVESWVRIVALDPQAFAVGALGTLFIMMYEARPPTGALRLFVGVACALAVLLVCIDQDGAHLPFIYYRF